ncbi:tRNA uridine-5-carboxymethylaminomethyl(34) synthesis GTPase MnmE [Altererythrobacter soli]|uniref:tRNA modification GTPase MnmE n=1 Tax=Croceibacterium soli TaxID=1739690 RepID=A0A6I4UP35_9SPHN|nr:tRNA uridine-5-carboxymethylaminomethyl(34) synthesis GTPase MnmE [Croceibacterium soli]MXP40186.1 tRNA uridine-5-carboxymethylaminomethyl(34) synthesis GTPase MnmE [Croceibacterium soli]
MDTIFALSSGAPPAAIAVVRISGSRAGSALERLCGRLPPPRKAHLARLNAADGTLLDQALVLWFPGPKSETGEDCAELQLHGGRAVVEAVYAELGRIDGFRLAQPGEFTRRAFANGKIDLLQVEGLADLVSSETELQRRAALGTAGGALSRKAEGWREALLILSARVEAALDFEDEDDVERLDAGFTAALAGVRDEIADALDAPHAETLREGYRVALAGPPNAGKSTLFNALVESEAAITAPLAGTTRDVLVRHVAIGGVPFTFVDMAGLRDESGDVVETIGIARAREEIAAADCVLWLGPEGEGPDGAWEVDAQVDRADHAPKGEADFRLSAVTGEGMDAVKRALVERARSAMPKPGQSALSRRQRELIGAALAALDEADAGGDPLLVAEQLRAARLAFDRLIGRAATEDMLGALFGRFCIGK